MVRLWWKPMRGLLGIAIALGLVLVGFQLSVAQQASSRQISRKGKAAQDDRPARRKIKWSPESPEVRQLVARGVEYLTKSKDDPRLGGKCIVALALLTAGEPADHPKVVAALKACRAEITTLPRTETVVYSAGIALVFLCTLDPQKHESEIREYLGLLESLQKSHGGWGYPSKPTGDTSMTQYGVLGTWEAQSAGIQVSQASVEKVLEWLLRTQDPQGGWGYQGNDPEKFERVEQTGVSHSLSAAGMGSTIICGHMLGLVEQHMIQDPSLPAVLKPIRKQEGKRGASQTIAPHYVEQAIRLGSLYWEKEFDIQPHGHWQHYYLYALERLMSFQELTRLAGRSAGVADWYEQGCELLASTQGADGSWSSRFQTGGSVDTAFSILFLLRSTKKRLLKRLQFGGGVLAGGRGLPKNVVGAKLRGGQVVEGSSAASLDEVVRILSDPQHPDYQDVSQEVENTFLNPEGAFTFDADSIPRLQKIAEGKSPELQVKALRLLGRSDSLDAVPILIAALRDHNLEVIDAARDSLRRISRKFDEFGIPRSSSEPEHVARAQTQWRAWYQTLRPNAKF